jgi:predicted porin
MKKSLVALAVLGAFAGAASAQSSVTLYGVIDMTLQRNDPKASGLPSTTGVNSGHQAGSRLGFRGSEDLGGGVRAIFTLENGYNPDNGTLGQGGRIFGRQAFAGLAGGFGDLVLGRVPAFGSGTGSYDMIGVGDPFGTGFGISSLASTFSTIGVTLRPSNSILYRSPSFGGFRFGVQYSFQVLADAELAGSGNNNSYVGAGASFGSGPVSLAVTYDQIRPTDAQKVAGFNDNQTHIQVGGSFDFKVVKLHAAYAQQKEQFAATSTVLPSALTAANTGIAGLAVPAGTTEDANSFAVGVTVPIGSGRVLASYQKRDGKEYVLNSTAGAVNVDLDRTVASVAYVHDLSRRTNVYVNYADSTVDGRLERTVSTTGTTASPLLLDAKQITFGVLHRF